MKLQCTECHHEWWACRLGEKCDWCETGTNCRVGEDMSKARLKLSSNRSQELGWVLDFKQLQQIQKRAQHMADVSLEDVESVALALIDLGYMGQPEKP